MSAGDSQRGRTARARGIRLEREVVADQRALGRYAVPIRNTPGGGDVLSIELDRTRGLVVVRIIECKSSTAGPFAHFLPEHRAELLETAARIGAHAELAWRPPRGKLRYIPSDTWPAAKVPAGSRR